MINDFKKILLSSKRKIVFHETCYFENQEILRLLSDNDLLFFDDCLYSQYLFIKDNMSFFRKRYINCILGFSGNIYRREHFNPNFFAICSDCHDKIHKNEYLAYNSYMSLLELDELLANDNIHLAAHGFNHLDIQNEKRSEISKCKQFFNDIDCMIEQYKSFQLTTNLFVFPYAYDKILLSYSYLKKKGFKYFFAGENTKRITIESIISQNFRFE